MPVNNPYDLGNLSPSGALGGNNPYGGYLTQMQARRSNRADTTYADAMTQMRKLIAQMGNTQAPQKPQEGYLASGPAAPSVTVMATPPIETPGVYAPSDYFKNLGKVENATGDPTIVNPASGATGKFQFIDKTWRDVMKQAPELQLTEDGRTDDVQQDRAIRYLTNQNAGALKTTLGRAPTHAELYVAHLLGSGYGSSVLKSRETPVEALVPDSFIKANPFLKGLDGNALVAMFAKKFR